MDAREDRLAEYYDRRYDRGYQEGLRGYEYARWSALRAVIPRAMAGRRPAVVLDYGCGSGLFTPLLRALYPTAEIWGCDISPRALELFAARHPGLASRLEMVDGHRARLADESVDLCLSVEVMEHVLDLGAYLGDVARLLRPGGIFVWTTPCANALSLEHWIARGRGLIRPTPEGYRVWAWEDPAHVRRLTSAEAAEQLARAGLRCAGFRFRSHLFSYLCDRLIRAWPGLTRTGERLMLLDFLLFRRLPNGASMIGWAAKPGGAS